MNYERRYTGLDNMRRVVAEVPAAEMPVIVVPHRRWEPGRFEDWGHATPHPTGAAKAKVVARGSWGGE